MYATQLLILMLWLRYLNFAGRWQISAGWDSSKMLGSNPLSSPPKLTNQMTNVRQQPPTNMLACLQISVLYISRGVVGYRVPWCCLHTYSFLM